MKLTASYVKQLLENSIEEPLIENLLGYYFGEKFVPALITENQIIFYSVGREKFYITDYHWEEDCLVLEGLKKLSFSQSEDNDKEEEFEKIVKGVFELDENRESFRKSLKKIKKIIAENEVVINEDVFLDRMKEKALVKAKQYLTKNYADLSKKGFDNWNSALDGFSRRMKELSDEIRNSLNKKLKEKIQGKELDKFYDYLDIRKIKFNYADGKGLYKILKISLPKSRLWINENEQFLKAKGLKYKGDMSAYSSAVEDTAKLLKSKKYVEDEEKNPAYERVSELLGIIKRKKNAKEFWKWDTFKNMIKEMAEDEIDVENAIKTFDILNTFNQEELEKLMEKTLVNIYEDPTQIGRAKQIAEVLDYIMTDEGYRDAYFEEILETEVKNTKDLINESDIGYFATAHRNPDDLAMIAVKNLATTIEDYIARYREDEMNVDDLRTLESALFKLNDIWARQRLTEADKQFLRAMVEGLSGIEKKDIEVAEKIVKAKDERRENILNFEDEMLKRNAEKKINTDIE